MTFTKEEFETLLKFLEIITLLVPTSFGFLMFLVRHVDVGGRRRVEKFIEINKLDKESTNQLIESQTRQLESYRAESAELQMQITHYVKQIAELNIQINVIIENSEKQQTVFKNDFKELSTKRDDAIKELQNSFEGLQEKYMVMEKQNSEATQQRDLTKVELEQMKVERERRYAFGISMGLSREDIDQLGKGTLTYCDLHDKILLAVLSYQKSVDNPETTIEIKIIEKGVDNE